MSEPTALDVKDDQQLVSIVQAHVQREPRTRPAEGGYPQVPRELLDAERAAKLLPSPRRNRWKAVQAFDNEVAELDRRQAELSHEAQDVAAQLAGAPQRDQDRLAHHALLGGDKPALEAPALEERLEELKAASLGIDRKRGEVLGRKEDYVVKHRHRLVREAERVTEAAAARDAQLIDQLAEARDETIELRSAAISRRTATRRRSTSLSCAPPVSAVTCRSRYAPPASPPRCPPSTPSPHSRPTATGSHAPASRWTRRRAHNGSTVPRPSEPHSQAHRRRHRALPPHTLTRAQGDRPRAARLEREALLEPNLPHRLGRNGRQPLLHRLPRPCG